MNVVFVSFWVCHIFKKKSYQNGVWKRDRNRKKKYIAAGIICCHIQFGCVVFSGRNEKSGAHRDKQTGIHKTFSKPIKSKVKASKSATVGHKCHKTLMPHTIAYVHAHRSQQTAKWKREEEKINESITRNSSFLTILLIPSS